jgi:hypothetical protein
VVSALLVLKPPKSDVKQATFKVGNKTEVVKDNDTEEISVILDEIPSTTYVQNATPIVTQIVNGKKGRRI